MRGGDPAGVLVVGALGKMGVEIRKLLEDESTLRLAGALEGPGHPRLGEELEGGVEVVDDAKRALEGCRVVIDFSLPQVSLAHMKSAADAGVAYVCGTTGIDEAGKAEIARLAERIPVIYAANFSVSVNVLVWLAREAARLLGPGFDAEIVELHHGMKRDAPSGTALRLGEAIAEGRGQMLADHLVVERAGETGARPKDAIGIQALRGGDNPGEHTVMFIGPGERVELTHRSATRGHFARGAVRAAAWLSAEDRGPGLHRIEQVLGIE